MPDDPNQPYVPPTADQIKSMVSGDIGEFEANVGGFHAAANLGPQYAATAKIFAESGASHAPSSPLDFAKATARASGLSWDEIYDFLGKAHDQAKASGLNDHEINNFLKGVPLDEGTAAKAPEMPNVPGELGASLRNFSDSLFGARGTGPGASQVPNGRTPEWESPKLTLGGLTKELGWGVVDFAKTFPGGVVNGAAATAEAFDGKQRTAWEWEQKALEASQFLGLFVGPAGKALGLGEKGAAAAAFPKPSEVLDGATGLSVRHPDGLTPDTLAAAQRTLGEHYVTTGEHPVDAAARAANDNGTLEEFHQRMNSIQNREHWLDYMFPDEPGRPSGIPGSIQEREEYLDRQTAQPGLGRSMQDREEYLDQMQASNPTGSMQDREEALDRYAAGEPEPSNVVRMKPLDRLKRTVAEGAGRKPADPIDSHMHDMAAVDRLVPPERVEDPQPVQLKTFRDLMTDSSGKIALPQGAIAPEKLFQPDPEIAAGVTHDVRAIFAPQSLAPNAAEMISDHLARSTIQTERAVGNLVRFGRAVGELSTPSRWEFNDALEAGKLDAYKGTTLGALGQQLRKELDYAYDSMAVRGIEPGYVEDYLPHMYQDSAGYQKWMQTRRPLAGGKAFTKERVFGSYAEAREAGFVPATDNPITMTALALKQMNRYIAAHDIVDEFKQHGVIQQIALKGQIPAEFERINGALGVTGEGNLYAPRDVARLVNNITDKGLSRSSLYGMVRTASNEMIQMSLAGPGYHTTFETLDAITSQVALAAQQISRLSAEGLMKAPVTLLTAPLAPVRNFLTGRKMINSLLGIKAGSPEIQTLADKFIAGGGRIRMGDEYRGSAYGDFLNAFRGTIQPSSGYATLGQEIAQTMRDAAPVKFYGRTVAPGIARAAFQLLSRTMDTIAAPLMQVYVPALKAGTFANTMRDALTAAPQMGYTEARHVANLINRSVDNRMGQMVYDNRFWNKTLRDISHVAVRSLGWNAGDITELPGGAIDLLHGRSLTLGDAGPAQISYRASYVVALPATMAMMGAVMGFMHGTWNENWTLMDYFFPPSGGTDAKGNPERIALPSYIKDIYNAFHHPLDEAKNKVSPLWPAIGSMLTNRDWYGGVIADPEHDDPITNVEDYGAFFAHQFMPVSIQTMKPEPGAATEISPLERMFGMRPAPWAIQNPNEAAKFEHKDYEAAVKKRAKMRAKDQQ